VHNIKDSLSERSASSTLLRKLKWVNTEGMAGPTFILLIASVVGGGCNFLYQLFMANNIANLAELNALLAIQYIVTVPALAVQSLLIRYVSKFKALGNDGAISWLVRRLFVMTFVAGVVLSLVLFVFLNLPQISEGLKITETLPILILSVTVFVSLVGPVGMGPLQGLQLFTDFGIQSVGNYLFKFVVGAVLVLLGFGLTGAMGGVLMGMAFGAGYSIYVIRRYLLTPGKAVESKEIWRFTVPASVGILCFTVLTNVDVILAQVLLDSGPANLYAAASTLAKAVMFVPTAVSAVMFPKVASLHAGRESTSRLLNAAFMLSFLMSMLVVGIYVLLPNVVLPLLLPSLSSSHALIIPVLQEVTVAMMLMGLANLFMLYGLATDGHAYVVIMGLSVAFLGVLLGASVAFGTAFTPQIIGHLMLLTGLLSVALGLAHLFVVERNWRPRRDGIRP
jgi:O-antigen/teichoic acid export membrane protein